MNTEVRNPKIQDVVVVFLSCKYEYTETFMLDKLTAITDKHYMTPFNFAEYRINPEEVIENARKEVPGVKLIILVNNNKEITRYNHMYRLHFKFEMACKAGLPIIITPLEDAYCPRHDTMTPLLEKECNEWARSVAHLIEDQKPSHFQKNTNLSFLN